MQCTNISVSVQTYMNALAKTTLYIGIANNVKHITMLDNYKLVIWVNRQEALI